MEEIRKLAMIYHAKLSNDQKEWTQRLFRKIDANGDGKVTIQEFFGFFITGGSDYLEKLFRFLDKNHNGILDFEECVTFFYMIASNRLLECDECGSLLLAAYFLCVECYNANREKTYNLCCSCYSDNNFSHAHSYFLDNYALLLQKEIKVNQVCQTFSQYNMGLSLLFLLLFLTVYILDFIFRNFGSCKFCSICKSQKLVNCEIIFRTVFPTFFHLHIYGDTKSVVIKANSLGAFLFIFYNRMFRPGCALLVYFGSSEVNNQTNPLVVLRFAMFGICKI